MRIVVLGGYGLFGRHICLGLRRLSSQCSRPIEIWIAGRSRVKAQRCLHDILARTNDAQPALSRVTRVSDIWDRQTWHAIVLDHDHPDFATQLAALRVNLVIHSAGPFQAQRYHVALAAIACGANYVDLADSRAFVSGITELDAAARAANVVVLSGASSVPAISSAVIDALAPVFAQIHSIDVGISPGNRTERGLATVAAILSYVGEPIPNWRNGQWIRAWGWLGLRRHRYPEPAGVRWLSDCDVPDVSLLTAHVPDAHSVRFGAGLEQPLLHFGLYALAILRRYRILPNLVGFAKPLQRASTWLQNLGSDVGAMHVQLRGTNHDGRQLQATWTLVASAGCGPNVPATPAVTFARAMAEGLNHRSGARPCVGEFSLAALALQWEGLPITQSGINNVYT